MIRKAGAEEGESIGKDAETMQFYATCATVEYNSECPMFVDLQFSILRVSDGRIVVKQNGTPRGKFFFDREHVS